MSQATTSSAPVEPAVLDEIVGRAKTALADGDLSQANRLMRSLIHAGIADRRIHAVLAEVASRLGLEAHARYHRNEAGIAAEAAPASTAVAGEPSEARYLLIRAWGAGFWGDVMHVAHQLLTAEASHRIPIVYWGRESRYRRQRMDNAWEAYFEPVSPHSIAELEAPGFDYFPSKWTQANLRTPRLNKDTGPGSRISALYFLNRPERVTVADYFTEPDDILPFLAVGPQPDGAASETLVAKAYRRIRLKPHLAITVGELAKTLLAERPVLGVHYRAPAFVKTLESAGKDLIGVEAYFEAMDRFVAEHPAGSIYLMTDFVPALTQFRERYGARLKTRNVLRLSDPKAQSLEYNTALDGRTLATEVILDVYLALACDRFLGDQVSGVTQAVSRLKEWPEGTITLFRRHGAWPLGHVRQHADPSPWWNPEE